MPGMTATDDGRTRVMRWGIGLAGKLRLLLYPSVERVSSDGLRGRDISYKEYPQSVAEIRSDISNNATDWAARDCLIDLLRQIDGGLKVPTMLICYTTEEVDNYKQVHYSSVTDKASSNRLIDLLGLLSRVKFMVNRSGE